MAINLEDVYSGLFSILNDRDKPILTKIILLHKAREKELLDEIDTYETKIMIDEKEFDDIVQEIESMMNSVDQSIDETTKLKEIIYKIRLLRVRQR